MLVTLREDNLDGADETALEDALKAAARGWTLPARLSARGNCPAVRTEEQHTSAREWLHAGVFHQVPGRSCSTMDAEEDRWHESATPDVARTLPHCGWGLHKAVVVRQGLELARKAYYRRGRVSSRMAAL